ncbi:MAG TPA: zinc ribbon domain-containing protein [Bryobacteraceae bacterium]
MQCTCGAQLPDDARFCHRCGRPQLEEDIVRMREEERVPLPTPPPPPPLPSKIDFGNRKAVTVSIAVAMLTLLVFLASSVLAPFAATLLILPLFCLSGFVAARWYMKQTGDSITAQAGARLGFMTALWAFLVVVVICVFMAVFISNPEWRDQVVSMVNAQGNPAAGQIAKLLEDPRRFIFLMMGELLVNFCLFTFPSMLGGMLGVRFSNKR